MAHGVAIVGATADLLAARYSLVVAIVGGSGTPYATRGWGLTVLVTQPAQIRLLLSRDDASQIGTGVSAPGIAVTAAEPLTLRAVQLKGRIVAIEPASEGDRLEVIAYCDTFFSAVHEADGTERRFLDLLVPRDFVACTVAVEEMYDQTPGPDAGCSLRGGEQ